MQLRTFNDEIVQALAKATHEVLAELAGTDADDQEGQRQLHEAPTKAVFYADKFDLRMQQMRDIYMKG